MSEKIKQLAPYLFPALSLMVILILVAQNILGALTVASQIDDEVLNSTIPHVNEVKLKELVDKIDKQGFEPLRMGQQ